MILSIVLALAAQASVYPGAGRPPSRPPVQAPAPGVAEARAFLAGVYAGYARPGGRGAPLSQPARLFEPALTAAIARDGATRLEADPFCAGQDWTPFVATIGPAQVAGRFATVSVRFRNGRPVALRFTLVRTAAGWRIWDMAGTDLPGLRARMLARAPVRRRHGDDAVD